MGDLPECRRVELVGVWTACAGWGRSARWNTVARSIQNRVGLGVKETGPGAGLWKGLYDLH